MGKYKFLTTISLLLFIIIGISNISKAASNDTSLKSISIEPSGYELSQDENDNRIYRVKVDNSVTSIKVNAVPNSKDTSISVSGNNELSVGTNKVTVTVTAKSGDTSNYVIYVRRSSAPIAQEQVVPNVQDEYNEESNDSIKENKDNNQETKVENNAGKKSEIINESHDNGNNTNNVEENNKIDSSQQLEQNEIKDVLSGKKYYLIGGMLLIGVIILIFLIKKKPRGKHS